MVSNILFHKIDNAQIIVFRIFFGLLMTVECWGALATGWVTETLVAPRFTFTFIGFEWTNFLLGETMYYIYGFIGLLGLFISLGAFYRVSTILFALGWSLVYLMQKEHYNNHYYLIMLVAWFMVFIPANRYYAFDARLWPSIKSTYTYFWTRLIFILQMFIVYTFAAFAKLYPGWLNGDFLMIRYSRMAAWLENRIGWNSLTECLRSHKFSQIFSWLGFGFDLLIVPLLLWKRTRIYAFVAAVFFHLFNSITLHIGIFPFFALSLGLFCFPPETIRRVFFPGKQVLMTTEPGNLPQADKVSRLFFTIIFSFYIAWQIYLPLRHWLIPGDVLWTEEGHRLSWRMMLRSKSAKTSFYMLDRTTQEYTAVDLSTYLTPLQRKRIVTRPDAIWQFAQYLRKTQAEKGKDVEVYVESQVSINRGPFRDYINKEVDLANTKWNYFGHQGWILPEPANP
ncbi:HTTM domain-containing protein [Sphingobacterium sp. LRF_L2]|uniref:HTTM domain-containing protein n=1 Tax=Sphingobacterium sp. LRF_L2 TaxID=3369421 RepID=UPI003F62400D